MKCHKGRNDFDNLMPAARPEIDQLHLLGKWELPTKIAKKYSNYIAKVKKAMNQKYKISEFTITKLCELLSTT